MPRRRHSCHIGQHCAVHAPMQQQEVHLLEEPPRILLAQPIPGIGTSLSQTSSDHLRVSALLLHHASKRRSEGLCAPLPDQVKQVAAVGQLHHNPQVLLRTPLRLTSVQSVRLQSTVSPPLPHIAVSARLLGAAPPSPHTCDPCNQVSSRACFYTKSASHSCEPHEEPARLASPPPELYDMRVHQRGVVHNLAPDVFLVPHDLAPLDEFYCHLQAQFCSSQAVAIFLRLLNATRALAACFTCSPLSTSFASTTSPYAPFPRVRTLW